MGDAVLHLLYWYGPLVLLPLFVALAAAITIPLAMVAYRKGALPCLSAIVVASVAALLIAPALVPVWIVLAPSPSPVPFEASVWRTKPWRRASMVQDLRRTGLQVGTRAHDVSALLGDHDGSDDRGDSWKLWRLRDSFDISSPELVVQYDRSDRIRRVFISPSFLDLLLFGAEDPDDQDPV